MQRRLTAGDHDTLQETLPAFKKTEKDFFGNESLLNFLEPFRKNELRVMTVPATEITSGRKDDTGRFFPENRGVSVW
jgi:hypothetical protein